MVTRPEVLAPAGDEACLIAAIRSGADAVYFGIRGHNARARANNFEVSDLPRIMGLLHAAGVKGYVPMNILAFDDELDSVEAAIRACDAAGVDALIVQDLGVCALARKVAPSLPVHASTQMTCTDADSIALAESLGCTRIVLARELSVDDIARIRERTSAELEVFVHGALCVSYSGQCLTSEAIGGRSANRGACAQACRLPYDLVVDGVVRDLGDIAYLLSPQDLEAASLVPQLAALDVHCLKIEGRLKGPEYVAAATRLYRAAVDALDAPGPSAVDPEAVRAARLTFSRGSDTGFLQGVDHLRLVDGTTCDHVGLDVGIVADVHRTRGRHTVQLTLQAPLKRGDGVLVQGGRGGAGERGGRVWDIADDAGQSLEQTTVGQKVWLWLGPDVDLDPVVRGRRVFQTDDPTLDKTILTRAEREPVREIIDIVVSGDIGVPFVLEARSRRGLSAMVVADGIVEAARSRPIDHATLQDKLGRLGDSPYALGTLTVALPDGVTLPLSGLNRARRQLTDALQTAALGRRLPVTSTPTEPSKSSKSTTSTPAKSSHPVISSDAESSNPVLVPVSAPPPPGLFVLCRTEAQAHAALDAGADGVWLDFLAMTGLSQAIKGLRDRGAPSFIGVAPPRIRKPGEEKITRFIDGLPVDGWLVRGLGPLQELWRRRSAGEHTLAGGPGEPLFVGDFSLNVTNQLTVAQVLGRGLDAFTPSFDLDETQLTALLADPVASAHTELVIHHPMPLFHTEHCVFAALLSDGKGHDYRTCGRPCESHSIALKDRAGLAHPVEADVGCRNTVFHARAQSGAELVPALQKSGVGRFRLELVREDAVAVVDLVAAYRALLAGTASAKATLKRLKTAGGYGVVKGSLRVLDDKSAEARA
jgi:putative protease